MTAMLTVVAFIFAKKTISIFALLSGLFGAVGAAMFAANSFGGDSDGGRILFSIPYLEGISWPEEPPGTTRFGCLTVVIAHLIGAVIFFLCIRLVTGTG